MTNNLELTDLPLVVWCSFLSLCSLRDRFRLRRVSVRWKKLSESVLRILPISELHVFADVFVYLPYDLHKAEHLYRWEAMNSITALAGPQIRALVIRKAVLCTGSSNKHFYRISKGVVFLLKRCSRLRHIEIDSCVLSCLSAVLSTVSVLANSLVSVALCGYLPPWFVKELGRAISSQKLFVTGEVASYVVQDAIQFWPLERLTFATGIPESMLGALPKMQSHLIQQLNVYLTAGKDKSGLHVFPSVLTSFKNLVSLKIVFCKLITTSVAAEYASIFADCCGKLQSLTSLEILSRDKCVIPCSAAMLDSLARLSLLRILVLGDPGVAMAAISDSVNATSQSATDFYALERLGFISWHYSKVTASFLLRFGPNLRQISLENCELDPGLSFKIVLASRLHVLDSLNLWRVKNLSLDNLIDCLSAFAQYTAAALLSSQSLQLGLSDEFARELMDASEFMALNMTYAVCKKPASTNPWVMVSILKFSFE